VSDSEVSETYDRAAHVKRLVAVARKRADQDDVEWEYDFTPDTIAEFEGEA
jgi:hypothetical protein